MRRIRPFLMQILAALFFCAPALYAQDPFPAGAVDPNDYPEFEDPVADWELPGEKTGSAFSRSRFDDEPYHEMLKAGQILAVAQDMVTRFDALEWGANEPKQQNILNQLQRWLGALEAALGLPGIDGPLDLIAEQNIFLAELVRQGSGLHILSPETITVNGLDMPGYFRGTSDELLFYSWDADEESVLPNLTRAQIRQWRLCQNALSNLVNSQIGLVTTANIAHLERAVVRWENVLENGYSQMPWESLLNGWWIPLPGAPDFGPPEHQWILMHPSFGIEVSVDPLEESRVKESLQIEVLGHVWYRGAKLDNYWGVSATVSLREDLDPGFGALVHIRRDWSLGVTWHDVNEDPFLYLSLDLLSFARGSAPSYAKRYNEVRGLLGME